MAMCYQEREAAHMQGEASGFAMGCNINCPAQSQVGALGGGHHEHVTQGRSMSECQLQQHHQMSPQFVIIAPKGQLKRFVTHTQTSQYSSARATTLETHG
jgi:hypothetical protein